MPKAPPPSRGHDNYHPSAAEKKDRKSARNSTDRECWTSTIWKVNHPLEYKECGPMDPNRQGWKESSMQGTVYGSGNDMP